MGLMHDLIGSSARLEHALVVGITFDQLAVDTVNALFGDLRPSRVIEKYRSAVEGRKLLADEIHVECHVGSLMMGLCVLGFCNLFCF
jgi:hypothetical protein